MFAMALIPRIIRFAIRKTLSFGTQWMDCDSHVTRLSMYRKLGGVLAKESNETNRVLCISDSKDLARLLGLRGEFVSADYPDYNIIDLHQFSDGEFDFIVSDQVLEHIEGDPHKAFEESLRLLKPGGIAVHTTCFINPVHGVPNDFWRFTPDALRYLAQGFSKVIACDGWGNRGVWFVEFIGLRYAQIPKAWWHPLRWILYPVAVANNPIWPIVTWVVARK